MRRTLTLDKDLVAIINRLRKMRRQSLNAIVNEALREGLKQMAAPPPRQRVFRTDSVDLGRCLVGNIDDVAHVLAVTESGHGR